MTNKLGVVQGNGDKIPEVPAIALGSKGLSPLTMASAYAAFANEGTYCTPIAIESITQKVGNEQKSLAVPKSTCSRAMSKKTADTINTVLRGVVDSGTGQEAGLTDRQSAGKTGTTDSRKNAWFVGYTPNLAGAVWVGSAKQNIEMTSIRIGGVWHDEVYGADTPGPIWKDAMTGALEGKQVENFQLVNIPDPVKKDKDKGNDGGKNNDNGGVTTDGGTTGTTDGGTTPTPTFSLPDGFIQGNDNGGNNGNGNGGNRG
jgi:membrane peptidoglycan carboxypeptidase